MTGELKNFPEPNLNSAAYQWARQVMARIVDRERAAGRDGESLKGLQDAVSQAMRRLAVVAAKTWADPAIYGPTSLNLDALQNPIGQVPYYIHAQPGNKYIGIGFDSTFGLILQSDSTTSDGRSHETKLTMDGISWRLHSSGFFPSGGNLPYGDLIYVRRNSANTDWELVIFDQVFATGTGGLSASILPTGATDGQVLTWDGAEWVAADLPPDSDTGGGGSGLPTSATTGQVLEWDGSAWVAADLPADVDPSAASLRSHWRGDWVAA